tara:strand:- start:65308 stop:66027 length:720 start_codon:yes stop_codon:yes gene_type:complete
VLTTFIIGGVSGCQRVGETVLRSVVPGASIRNIEDASPDQLVEMIEQTNEQCPVAMDAFTSLEHIKVIDDLNIEYQYSVNQKGSRLVGDMDANLLRDIAVEQMKGNAMAVAVAERGLRVRHVYRDETGQPLLQYTIDQQSIAGESSKPDDSVQQVKSTKIADVLFLPEDPATQLREPTSLQDEFFTPQVDLAEPQDQANGQATDENAEPKTQWVPEDLSPSHVDETQPWRVQKNPFFES